MHPAIFLDRDGVIIENRHNYVRSWADVKLIPPALASLAQLRNSPYKIVIVTNQAGIGRGLIPVEVAAEINQRLKETIENAGGRLDGIYVCPHQPSDGCSCRKPEPGLILQAARELQIDLEQSILIGDALTDLQAGIAAGVGTIALVRTGRGTEQAREARPATMPPFTIYDHLAQALEDLT